MASADCVVFMVTRMKKHTRLLVYQGKEKRLKIVCLMRLVRHVLSATPTGFVFCCGVEGEGTNLNDASALRREVRASDLRVHCNNKLY